MFNNILDTWVLPNASHTNTVGVVAPQILHEHVCAIWLRSKAVIPNINSCIGDSKPVDIIRIKSICVLRFGLRHVSASTTLSF